MTDQYILISEELILQAEQYARKNNIIARIAFNDHGEPVLMTDRKPAFDIALVDSNGYVDIKRKIKIIPKLTGVKVDPGKLTIDSILP